MTQNNVKVPIMVNMRLHHTITYLIMIEAKSAVKTVQSSIDFLKGLNFVIFDVHCINAKGLKTKKKKKG